jgi:hypothetical protein
MKKTNSKSFLILLIILLNFSPSIGQHIVSSVNEEFKGVKNLEVEGAFCKVEIKGGDGSIVSFQGEIKSSNSDADYQIRHSFKNNTLKVWIEKPRFSTGNNQGLLIFDVPKDLFVVVDNSSGSVLLDNIKSRQIELVTSSGSINAKNIEAEGKMKSSSGSIKLEDVVGVFHLSSSSGSQTLKNVKGNVRSNLSSGSFTVKGIEGDVNSSTSSGSINVYDLTGKFEASASSGSIKGDNLLFTGNVKVSTSSGSINLKTKNNIDELSFDLSASSGSLTVGNKRYKNNFVAKRGPITIKGNSSSGSQQYL